MSSRPALISLLRESPVYCAVINRHAEPEASNHLRQLGCRKLQGLPFACYTQAHPKDTPLPPSPQNNYKLLYYYTMDTASLYPVLALDMHSSDTILDLCAAPGGKAFIMLQIMNSEEGGALALNDINTSRVKRLRDVIHRCVGNDYKQSIRITRRKGEEWGRIEESAYKRVLVDAPCSSDRHKITNWEAKNKFYPETKKYGKLQHNLLLAGLHAAENDGVVVYSTCTMSTHENDEVVDKVIESARKLGYKVTTSVSAPHSEVNLFGSPNETKFGRLIIPSPILNIGPMYVSKLHLTKN